MTDCLYHNITLFLHACVLFQDNKLTYLAPHEFRHLSRLQFLHLDGNKLTTLKDLTFDGQALAYLGKQQTEHRGSCRTTQ